MLLPFIFDLLFHPFCPERGRGLLGLEEQPLQMTLTVKDALLGERLPRLRHGESLHVAQAQQRPVPLARHSLEKPRHPRPIGAAAAERRVRALLFGAEPVIALVQRIQLPLQMFGLLPQRLLARL